jgi:hypothetical protein
VSEIRIHVPTVNDDAVDFLKLFRLYHSTLTMASNVAFDFSQCNFLRQNAVVFVGGLARLVQQRGMQVRFDVCTMRDRLRANLSQNGFLQAFGFGIDPWAGNSARYREDIVRNAGGIVGYISDQWLRDEWVNFSPRLKNAITGRMWEIFANAFEHSGSQVGVISCGQLYPRLGEACFTIADFGIGIPGKVREFRANPGLRDSACLKWAFMRGTTTSPGTVGRGLGLDVLKEFISLNNGRLETFSGCGWSCIQSSGEQYTDLELGFDGTLVNISLRCDESYYCFKHETDEALVF